MFCVDYDARTGIIRCVTQGFKSVGDLPAHTAAIKQAVQTSYRDFGHVRMLVIESGQIVQSSAVMDQAKANLSWFRPDDRIAVVASSQLVKIQATRTLGSERFQVFGSEDQALAWLSSEEPDSIEDIPAGPRNGGEERQAWRHSN